MTVGKADGGDGVRMGGTGRGSGGCKISSFTSPSCWELEGGGEEHKKKKTERQKGEDGLFSKTLPLKNTDDDSPLESVTPFHHQVVDGLPVTG